MIAGLVARVRSLWRGLRRRSDVEAEMTEEFRLHLELRAADLVRSGLAPAEAARQARLEFGGTERYKEEARDARGLGLLDEIRFSWLDFKLGFRMLARYPGLTLVGGLAIAFAILVGAGVFEFSTQVVNPTLPLDEGDRIVALRNWDAEANQPEMQALHDFVTWRAELKSVEDLGAYRTLERNLITGEGQGEPLEVAEISASAFRLARVPALLGRSLVEADEQAGAPPVVVIGYDVWQARFAGDSNVVGRTVRLGATQATVVGVMPTAFALPISHSLWTPFRLNVADYERRRGPRIQVFGRLAPDATLDEAQAELTTLGQRAAADYPQTHRHLRPQVRPYARVLSPFQSVGEYLSLNLFVVMLLVLVCANVALLMFARATTRESEIIVRTALGASRGRVITQLFAEALVLGGIAAVAGLAAAGFGLRWGLGAVEAEEGALPFWFRSSLSPVTVLYAAVLTLLGAAIAGVIPALKVTRGLQGRLRAVTAGGGGLKFGGVWTAVIVTQVAVTVAFPAVPYFLRRDAGVWTLDPGFPATEYLSVRLELDRDASPAAARDTSRAAFLARYDATSQELKRRLMTEPAVSGVTVATALPRMYHGWNQIEVDQGALTPRDSIRGHRVSSVAVDADYFDVLGTPILSGRGFHSGDLGSAAPVVIVNQPFVEQVLGGRNPIGRRVRYLAGESCADESSCEEGPWHEIVGVVRDIGTISGYGRAGIYHPLDRQATYPVHLAIHVRGDPVSFAPRLRAVAATVDPTLRLAELMPLSEVVNDVVRVYAFWVRLTAGASAIALLLSLAGVYAVMSFTVARRTREIGIRVALGGDPRRILASIFRRPLTQVGVGVLAGGVLTAALAVVFVERLLRPSEVTAVIAYATLMFAVCLLACIVPTRRALRVEPTEALKAD